MDIKRELYEEESSKLYKMARSSNRNTSDKGKVAMNNEEETSIAIAELDH